MYYDQLGISSGDLCAAVALALVHDASENCLGTPGFPQIDARRNGQEFVIDMRLDQGCATISITTDEACRMVEAMKSERRCLPQVFQRIQEATAKLEMAMRNNSNI
ncbi:hypothetical protein [Erythrobacter sp. EC-HK427]|uniref:hypothetical protein n=1 Tax=Erythrobacter sp. EC-HK427 TaxID=2038396 RepID=UPI00125BEAE1|nr:hypothetical protein [Erythrobacter sp. EC-HK427]VVS95840.1 conserved hypothetical protein [Erythrobacter sp. EC-HK427]